jgi:hypothetical protein
MDYDFIIETHAQGSNRFSMELIETNTQRRGRFSDLPAGVCAAAVVRAYNLCRASGYRVQVRICEPLAECAQQFVASLN